jgi:hypothetical protein
MFCVPVSSVHTCLFKPASFHLSLSICLCLSGPVNCLVNLCLRISVFSTGLSISLFSSVSVHLSLNTYLCPSVFVHLSLSNCVCENNISRKFLLYHNLLAKQYSDTTIQRRHSFFDYFFKKHHSSCPAATRTYRLLLCLATNP